jgi:outer membrane protein OmpA-like peptidoglycan-associated protein
LDYIIYAKETNNIGEFNMTKDLEEYDWLTTWGLEWWPWKNISVTGRYMHGFRKVLMINNVSANNRGFQITLGLRFHKSPPLPSQVVITPTIVADKDSDGDGILDSKDKCPTVPGYAKYEGCPIPDTDKDGINDEEDKCPEMAGYPELNGCPYPDRDKDGVTDNKDRCPDEPGSTKNDGCPITDRDNDGVPDSTDRCPDEAGPVSNQGCPEVKEEVIQKTAEIASSIYFQFNSAKLEARSNAPLDELVQILKDNPTYRVSIEGHTDNVGSNEYNQKLSERRTNTVRSYLVNKGIDGSRLTAIGFGEEKPIASNATDEGRAQNRRVELKLSN